MAAETEEIAEEALALIEVEYEELPAVFDPEAALGAGAPRSMHEVAGGNLVNLRYQFAHGDVDARLRARRTSWSRATYRLNYVTTACLGTMVAIAALGSADGEPHDVVARPRCRSSTSATWPRRSGITGDRVRVHAAAGRRQLRPRPRPLPDRRHRRAPGPARAAAREDRVRARSRSSSRARRASRASIHAAHRGAIATGRLLARDAHVVDRQRRLRLVGLDDART